MIADMSAIAHAIAALRGAFDMTKGMIAARDGRIANEQIIELQAQIMTAQSGALAAHAAQLALADEIRELESKLAKLQAWARERKRYFLKEIAPSRFAYTLKPNAKPPEPAHLICAACYQRGEKSILQGFNAHLSGWVFTCPACKTEIYVGG